MSKGQVTPGSCKAPVSEWLPHVTLSCVSVLCSEKEFHDAAKHNDTARMEELIRRGVDIKAKNNVGPSGFLAAAGP